MKKRKIMKEKDYSDRLQRLSKRNAIISLLFYELTITDGYGFMEAYAFLEGLFGIDERQIRKILRQKSKVELSSDDLTKLAVLLHRISKTKLK